MKICIVDCNHGSVDIERVEAERLSKQYSICIEIQYTNSSQENIVRDCQGSDIIITQRREINGLIIDQIPTCKVVVRYGVGLDNINVPDMQKRGVKVINFPTFCTEEVANHTLALIMFLYRKLNVIQSSNDLAEYWGKPDLLSDLQNATNTTIGIIGLGRIGSAVCKRLLVCGFDVVVYDPYVDDNYMKSFPVRKALSLRHLFEDSDIISVHCPLTEETEGMVNLPLMKKMTNGYIVNTARGKIVHRSDLLFALRMHILRAAFIDVCDPEPADYFLQSCPNLYLTPHVAFYSRQSLDNLKRQVIIQSVEAFLDMQSD